MADSQEVYYCGHCRHQQRPSEGERCKICGRITVSWYTAKTSQQDVHRRWQHFNPRG